MNKVKILHLISSAGFFGAENVVIELAKQLLASNYEPIIGVFNNIHNNHTEIADVAKSYNLKVKLFTCNGQFDLKTIMTIRNFIKKNDILIIHSHGYKSNFYALMANLYNKNLSSITTCHLWTQASFKNRIYESLDKKWLNRFDRIVTVSDELMDEVLTRRISESKVTTIYNGIDLDRFNDVFNINDIRKKLNIPSHFKVIGTIGRLNEQKGHVFIIESAPQILKAFPDTIFVIVGDGYLKQTLQEKVVDAKLEKNFIFTGIYKNIPEILAAMDIFILPSLAEGLPMALLEAMAAKKPIIASKVGSIPDVIIPNETGLLIEPRDVSSLEKSIIELLNDKNKAARLAENGYKTIINKFSSKIMAKKYLDIYETLLRAPKFL